MKEYIDRIEELCALHGIEMPGSLVDLKPSQFKSDRREVQKIVNYIYELNSQVTDLSGKYE